MPESIDDRKIFSLTEVANSIRKTIAERYTTAFWVKAEINKLNTYAKSGHCFPELVEKKESQITCEMRATIWKNDVERINRNFKTTLNESLKDGIKVLMLVNIAYEPKYGLSLVIKDIDPSYSLGELEREKKETIEKLKKENLFDKNKKLNLSLLPQRIAVISIETSKGYQDFIKVIDKNIFGYRFFHMLFPAVLQGDASIRTIQNQLKRIACVKKHFDAVAIIRGGGGDVGLSSFNNYDLAKSICNFSLPVFTGIGHSTNLTVCEMVAFQSAITPTELGDYFLQRFHDVAVPVQRAQDMLIQQIPKLIELEKRQFSHSIQLFKSSVKNILQKQKHNLKEITTEAIHETKIRLNSEHENISQSLHSLKKSASTFKRRETENIQAQQDLLAKYHQRFIKTKSDEINQVEKMIRLVDPVQVLKRGYTITTVNGTLLKSTADVKKGDKLVTKTTDGIIISEADQIRNAE